ncbi:Stp1/IreP family PP2C-type Ser/Thr phosphatase, partial [Flavobacteriaceae bacterium]|nr:Stp1/IreP family PP2C-type Ser/Thr phosphatase [Flavobacteriaceae bacterium]
MDLKHFSKTVVGLVRKANEDYIGFLTNDQTNGNGDIFVVCDGMGGHVGGATASKKAVECILEYFKNETHPNPILALEKAISFANEQIFLFSQDNPVLKGMGTTCTALLQKDDNVYIAHVGDSRIYLNTDSKLYRVTKDHSFVQKLVDAGQLADSEMENHPRKNELTRALGISSNVEVEVSEKPLIVKNGDKFLMCSDGLCGLVNDPTISHIINKEKGFKAVEELIQLALNAGGNDNISVGIIDVVSSPHLKTVFKDQTNNRSNLLETQVFDASAFKKDRNLFYILNRYKYYVLSFVIITILSIYLFSSDLIVIKQPSADKSNEGKIG